jgi:hypothetical protein
MPHAEVLGEAVGEVGWDAVGDEHSRVGLCGERGEAEELAGVAFSVVVQFEDVDQLQPVVAGMPDDDGSIPPAIGASDADGEVHESDRACALCGESGHGRARLAGSVAGLVSRTAALRKRPRPA